MTQDSKHVSLDHINRINAGDLAGAASLVAEDCVNHAAVPEAQGRKGFMTIIEKLRTAFPDMQAKVEDVLVDGDRAMVRTTFTGTQRGPLGFTRLPLPATGKPVKVEQIHIFRVTGGKIVEHWFATDAVGMFRQLGLQITLA